MKKLPSRKFRPSNTRRTVRYVLSNILCQTTLSGMYCQTYGTRRTGRYVLPCILYQTQCQVYTAKHNVPDILSGMYCQVPNILYQTHCEVCTANHTVQDVLAGIYCKIYSTRSTYRYVLSIILQLMYLYCHTHKRIHITNCHENRIMMLVICILMDYGLTIYIIWLTKIMQAQILDNKSSSHLRTTKPCVSFSPFISCGLWCKVRPSHSLISNRVLINIAFSFNVVFLSSAKYRQKHRLAQSNDYTYIFENLGKKQIFNKHPVTSY